MLPISRGVNKRDHVLGFEFGRIKYSYGGHALFLRSCIPQNSYRIDPTIRNDREKVRGKVSPSDLIFMSSIDNMRECQWT